MARGKLKYKDVVGGRQGKRKKSQNTKPRKKYNLQRNDKKLRNPKRKYNDNKYKNHNLEELQTKKPKLEEPVETESSSESEVEDDLKKLLNTFDGNLNNKKSLAIDSSDSDSETEKEDKNISEDSSDSSSESETVENKSISEDESTLNNLVGNIREEGSLPDESESKDSETEGNHKTDLNEPISMGTSEHESLTEEETEELEIDAEDSQNDENDMENLQDPFVKHVFYELHDSVLESFANNPISVNMYSEYWPKLGKLNIQIPKCSKAEVNADSEFTIAEKKIYAPPGKLPKRIDVKSAKFKDLHVKSQIIANLNKANKSIVNGLKDILTPLQTELLSILNNYQDLYYPERTYNNAEEVRFAYCLHAANHILKTRLKVIHHNARLSKKDEVPDEFRDQGLVRPKVLIIVPFKDAAYKTIQMLIDIILPEVKGNVMNKKRFIDDYTGNELILPKKNPKPEDYEQTFQGNTSDDFKMGITVTKKSLKLYADFYSSDVIVASPLGLRTIIGAEGEQERDYDFLASIELLILDQMEIFLMQNWDHIFHILNHMHLQPKESHGTDFSRVRTWSLNGWAKYYRQTLIFSSLILPEINAVFNKKCQNYAGKVRVSNQVEFGSISQVFVQLPHVFHRFDAQNTAEVLDARFEFFMSKILSQQKDSMMKQTVIFIPNYFDYVRIRNYFKREDLSFVQICEYSKEGKVARARDMFYHGDSHFLLYTERFHFFNRKRIKGIRHLVFYQPPNFPHFYYEMCNLMQEANMNKKVGNMSNMTVTVIYSKYDVHQLSAIVGTERAAKMIQSERKVHMLVTGVD